mmetsp:Transcript_1856/g.3322  ORF Transcript_1856/g.3322 Transcript_1856/m.3322 type:complete len:87 (+) Transcript_1856:723-983(+)
MAKKVGGSQRQKALAAAKRKRKTPFKDGAGNNNDDDDDAIDLPKESELEVLAKTADLVVLSKPEGMFFFTSNSPRPGKGIKGKKWY